MGSGLGLRSDRLMTMCGWPSCAMWVMVSEAWAVWYDTRQFVLSVGGVVMFRCDPVAGVGRFGWAGRRVLVGECFGWVPGGDVDEFVGFVGDGFVAVGGLVYRRLGDGLLAPFDVNRRLVAVRPPAGDVVFLSPDEFTEQWASWVEDRPTVDAPVDVVDVPVDGPDGVSVPDVKRRPGRPKKDS